MNPWNIVDPQGTISCIPKPGGDPVVSLPGETPFECVIRWKDRAEEAERKLLHEHNKNIQAGVDYGILGDAFNEVTARAGELDKENQILKAERDGYLECLQERQNDDQGDAFDRDCG
jgi:hypothetical protein